MSSSHLCSVMSGGTACAVRDTALMLKLSLWSHLIGIAKGNLATVRATQETRRCRRASGANFGPVDGDAGPEPSAIRKSSLGGDAPAPIFPATGPHKSRSNAARAYTDPSPPPHWFHPPSGG